MKSKIIIFSGAGISAPSGINTYRGQDGYWENEDLNVICNQSTWKRNYEKVHKFYNDRRLELKDVEPNIAHKTIARWQEEYGLDRVINITQNIDDLFERAGSKAIHLHGELPKMECQDCKHVYEIGYEKFDTKNGECPECNSKFIKPFVVFYGSTDIPKYRIARNVFSNMNKNDILIVIGTMGNVFNIGAYAEVFCQQTFGESYAILNNMEESIYIKEDTFDDIYYESCEEAIIKIDETIKGRMQ